MDVQSTQSSLVQKLGPSIVSFEEKIISKYSGALNGSTARPLCVAFPETEEQILLLLQHCNEQELKVYPLSKGKNFGYGDSLSTSSGHVILDLSRMNKIVQVNEKLAYVTIQPGVTQHQLAEYLIQNNHQLQLDVTGAGLDASIVGNILERGFGHSEYGDRFSRIIRMKIILAGGEIINTGFGDIENALAKNTYRYAFGPMLDGLFSQSNFGIITEMTFELMPKAECLEMFIFSSKDSNQLASLVTTVRQLRLEGIVNSAVHIANKARAVGEKENKLAGEWNASGAISGPAAIVRAQKKVIRKYFRKNCSSYRLVFINEKRLGLLKWAERILKIPVYHAVKSIFDLQKGVPTDEHIRTLLNDDSVSSATLNAQSLTNCFEWINAVCPADEEAVRRMINILVDLFKSEGYDFRVTITAINPRSFILISNITFPNEEKAIEKAQRFKKKCYQDLAESGFYPYRSGSGLYSTLPERTATEKKILQKLKTIFDPKNVIAPGKYNI
jgi:4-cresol dehydrogenase (hydroxylating) flavoprotein subunit